MRDKPQATTTSAQKAFVSARGLDGAGNSRPPVVRSLNRIDESHVARPAFAPKQVN